MMNIDTNTNITSDCDAHKISCKEEESTHHATSLHHAVPFVSEEHEGLVWFEWLVAGIVCVAAVLAFIGKVDIATYLLGGTSILCAVLRLILRSHSPWKVRSIAFDAFIGISFGVGLIATYISILLL